MANRTPPKRKFLPVLDAAPRVQVPCLTCALCCTYVAVEISAPSSVRTATEILWYLYHERVSVYCGSDDEWFVQFETRCRHLMVDNKCGVYEHRPQVCREHSELTCEVNADDEGLSLYTPESFLEYLKGRSRRIHSLVLKGFRPPESAPARPIRPVFERRFLELRELGRQPRA
jgi:Fe-S-cluster containining protein